MEEIRMCGTEKNAGEYDVVVCGAGPAGWVAAVSAARAGRRVALVERQGILGGTASASLVIPISAFFFQGKRVVGGIAWEFVRELERLGAAQVELPKGHISVNLEYYKLVAQRMVLESGVDLYTNTLLIGCRTEKGRVRQIVAANKSGLCTFTAKCFIDATGEGDLCEMAGVPMMEPDGPRQPASMCFILEGVDTDTELLRDYIHHDGKNGKGSCNQEIHDYLTGLMKERKIPQFCGPWFNTLVRGKCLVVNITRAAIDATDAEEVTRAEFRLREDMFALVEALRERYKEFRDCEIVWSASNAGVRESRRIRGEYTLTVSDFEEGRVFPCPVAHCAHPMDIHIAGGSDQILIPLKKDCFVPYRTMVSRAADNLIAAGRCISVESGPFATVRIQATVMSIGEAAGVMAALFCEDGAPVWSPDEKKLAERIRERGFVL